MQGGGGVGGGDWGGLGGGGLGGVIVLIPVSPWHAALEPQMLFAGRWFHQEICSSSGMEKHSSSPIGLWVGFPCSGRTVGADGMIGRFFEVRV